MRQKPKLSAEDFKSPMGPDVVAKGLTTLPKMNDAMRLAGMRDGIGLAQARAKSAARAELRAKARGDTVAGARAARAKSEATALASAYQTEVTRVETGLADVLTTGEKPVPAAGCYDLRGVVMTAQGTPADCVDVQASLADGPAVATTTTSAKGIFHLSIRVGDGKDAIPEGSTICLDVLIDGNKVEGATFPTLTAAADQYDDVILTLPSEPQDGGICDWFSNEDRPSRKSPTRLPKRNWPWD